MKKATHQLTKEHNRNLVLKTICDHESISRAELARLTGLTRTTVSELVKELMDEGLVSEIGTGLSTGGKSPILLSLEDDSRWLIGLDLAQYQFRGAIVNLRGRVQEMAALPVEGRVGEEALPRVFELLDTLIEKAGAPGGRPLVGIGVGTAGLINTREGTVINAVNLDWRNLPLSALLEARYHLPVSILNDSQAAAIGEFSYGGRARAEEQLVVINIRHGIGAGIIINGALFQGDGGSAGEIGHIVVIPHGGLPCRCGKSGCLETVASAQALIWRARMLVGQHPESLLPRASHEIDLDAILRAYDRGDTLSRDLVLETGHYLGMAIANLAGVLNIQHIILSGDMTCFGDAWLDAIQKSTLAYSLQGQSQNTRIEIGRLGGNTILLGASAMLANNYALLFNRSGTYRTS